MGKTVDTGEESRWVLTEELALPCHVAELREVGCGQVRHFAHSARRVTSLVTCSLTAPLA